MSDQLEVSISDLAGNILTKPVRINHSEVSPGWNRVNFSEVIDCTDRDAELHLSFIGTGALAVTLAPSIPLERFHPKKHDNISVGDSPLAIKVWRGLAGVHPQLPDIKMSKGNHVRHRSGEMPKAFHYHTDGGDLDFEAVQYWANEDGFLVHPPSCGMTVGVIENLELKNLNSVTAFVNNAHREGPTLSFAIGLIMRTGDSFQSVHIPDVLGPWLTLPPLGWGEVHVTLPESTSGKFDLFLVTMATKEQGNRLAWGLFRGFMFNTENPA